MYQSFLVNFIDKVSCIYLTSCFQYFQRTSLVLFSHFTNPKKLRRKSECKDKNFYFKLPNKFENFFSFLKAGQNQTYTPQNCVAFSFESGCKDKDFCFKFANVFSTFFSVSISPKAS